MRAPSPPPPNRPFDPAPRRKTAPGCPVEQLLQFLGKPYVLAILHEFGSGGKALRFVELQKRLEISPNTLSDRLHDLVEAGFLTRTPYQTIPPRVDYESTPKARELQGLFETMTEWARRNDLGPVPMVSVAISPSARTAGLSRTVAPS